MPTSARAILHYTYQKGPNILKGSVILRGHRNYVALNKQLLPLQDSNVLNKTDPEIRIAFPGFFVIKNAR